MVLGSKMIDIRETTLCDIPAIARVHVQADWDTFSALFGSHDTENSELASHQLRPLSALMVRSRDPGPILNSAASCAASRTMGPPILRDGRYAMIAFCGSACTSAL